jgi:hypothetical protein
VVCGKGLLLSIDQEDHAQCNGHASKEIKSCYSSIIKESSWGIEVKGVRASWRISIKT